MTSVVDTAGEAVGAFPVLTPVRDEDVRLAVRAVVARWLRLVAADAQLVPYLVGVDAVAAGSTT